MTGNMRQFSSPPAWHNLPTLAAAATHRDTLRASAMVVEAVDQDARLISGLILPYGEVGYTTAGPVMVPGPGRIELPEDLGRVKLVDEHQTPPRSVGWAVAARDTERGLRAQFRIANTPDGDRVLAEYTPAEDGGRARDGFSVELVDITLMDNGGPAPVLERGGLSLVAAVTSPAFTNAREDGLAASLIQEGTRMNEEQRARLAELLAIPEGDRTEEQATDLQDLLVLAAGESGLSCEREEEQEEEQAEEGQEEQAQAGMAASRRRAPARTRARVPATGGNGGGRRRGRHTVSDLAAAQARIFRGESRPALEAALADITSTANIWTARDDYAGELWSGVDYTRRYVDLLTSGPLPSYKGTGWRWVVPPEVDDYAGDKAAVPSNSPTTEATSWTAARLAGAHDLDRKFFDFGDQEFISSYYRQMAESYAMQSDDKARLFVLSLAEAIAGSAGTTIYHAAAKAAQGVYDATGGRTPDYLLVNAADTFALLNTTANDAPDPRVLEMFGVTPDKFMQVPGVAAGTVVAGIKGAGKFRELAASPIRVEALNIANGGVDGGVFGYYATEETFTGGVKSATFAAV